MKNSIPDIKERRADHSSCSVKGTAYLYGGYLYKDGSYLYRKTIEYMPFKTNGEPENTRWASFGVKNVD